MGEVRYEAAVARQGRIVVGRMLPGTDLMAGLEQVCDDHGIAYAAVQLAYGSLSRADFKFLQVPSHSPESRATLMPHRIDARVEFLAGQGLVCGDGADGRDTHLHGAISDESGRVLGGHFNRGGNPVYNNMDFVLVELLDVRLDRVHDPETDTVEMVVHQAPT